MIYLVWIHFCSCKRDFVVSERYEKLKEYMIPVFCFVYLKTYKD